MLPRSPGTRLSVASPSLALEPFCPGGFEGHSRRCVPGPLMASRTQHLAASAERVSGLVLDGETPPQGCPGAGRRWGDAGEVQSLNAQVILFSGGGGGRHQRLQAPK